MFDIISIGAATTDIFIKSDSILESNRFISIKRSSKNEITTSLICSGGGATNSATTFARLGLKAATLSLIGDDPFSLYIKNDLRQEKINPSLLVQKNNTTTDFSLIVVAADGARSILTNRGDSHLESRDVPWSKLKSRWLYVTSLEGNLPLLEELIGYALENHLQISFNPGLRELKQRRELIPLLKHLDFLLVNRQEAEILADIDHKDKKIWDRLRTYSPLVAVTNGHLGAKILTPTDTFFSPVLNTHPVDETGAGDAFGSAFVAALLYGYQPSEALNWGIRNSASVVSALGAKAGILSLKQISR